MPSQAAAIARTIAAWAARRPSAPRLSRKYHIMLSWSRSVRAPRSSKLAAGIARGSAGRVPPTGPRPRRRSLPKALRQRRVERPGLPARSQLAKAGSPSAARSSKLVSTQARIARFRSFSSVGSKAVSPRFSSRSSNRATAFASFSPSRHAALDPAICHAEHLRPIRPSRFASAAKWRCATGFGAVG